jgi:hypothetical protein
MSKTRDKLIIFWSCRHSSQIALMRRSLFRSQSFLRTTMEFWWFPRKRVIKLVSNSSSRRVPWSILLLLIAKRRYSGQLYNGVSNNALTFLSYTFSERFKRISTTSGDDQTSSKLEATSVTISGIGIIRL